MKRCRSPCPRRSLPPRRWVRRSDDGSGRRDWRNWRRAVALRVQDAEEQDASLSLRVAQEEAEASKALAEEARRSAEDEGSRTRAEVFALRATSEQDRAARWAQVEREQESNAEARDTAAEMLAELSARVVSIEERHRLDPGRADPVETYRAIMEHRTRWMHDDVYVGRFVQEEVQRHAETLAALGAERTKLQSFRQGSRVTEDQELVDALDAWSVGIEDGQLASEASLAASIERYTDVTRDVRELHSLRRRLGAYVPLSLRRAETGGLLQSVVLEGRHWLVSLKIGWAPRLNELNLPSRGDQGGHGRPCLVGSVLDRLLASGLADCAAEDG